MVFSASVLWLILAVLLGILELMLSTFYLLVLAVAACSASALAYLAFPIEWQVVAFALVSVIGAVWIRRIRALQMTNDAQAKALQNLDEGQTVDVVSWNKGRTLVQYRGAQWSAEAIDQHHLEAGLHKIVEIRGNTLILQKL